MRGLLEHTVVGGLIALGVCAGLMGIRPATGGSAWTHAASNGTSADTTERDTIETADAARDTTRRRADVAADSLIATLIDSVRVQQLFGNVQVDQDSTRIRSDRAVRFLQQREYLFTNDVVIFERGDTLTADSVRYDEVRKVGMARGNVRLTDGDLQVQAPSGRYFADQKRSEFREGVTLVDSASTLTSDAGEYFSDAERAEFYGNVRFEDDDTYLEADSVTYFRSTGNTVARGQVFIRRKGGDASTAASDTTTRTFLFGNFARNERDRNESQVRGNALLVQIRADSVGAPDDTLLVRARRLHSSEADSLRRLIAIDSVRIWQQDIAATADSVVYDRIAQGGDALQREETRLYNNPMTWFDGTQVWGDTIRVKARGRSVDTVHVYGNAFAAQRDTTLDKINQLKGKSMTAYFRNDSLRRIDTAPNAQVIFFKEENGKLGNAGKASADLIKMWFKSGEIQDLRGYRGIDGDVYGQDLAPIPDPFQLEGFRWLPEQQPTKRGLLQDPRVQDRLRGNVLVVRPMSEREGALSRQTAFPSNRQP